MNPAKFFKNLRSNFEDLIFSGLIHEDILKFTELKNPTNIDDYESLVTRLYHMATDPEKKIELLINQYAEGIYLYLMKIENGLWLFIFSESESFAKLHFYVKYLLSTTTFDTIDDSEEAILSAKEQASHEAARRIQDLLLPDLSEALSDFSKFELFYAPRHIIGGDFYWAKKENTKTWLVVGDCTGHGAEGALSSVSMMSLLNQVYQSDISPHQLIKNLNRKLNQMQKQKLAEGYGIGCEMIAICMDKLTHEITYSGTGLNFYYWHNGEMKIRNTRKVSFEQEEELRFLRSRHLSLTVKDRIFIFSDGLVDQLNEQGHRWKKQGLNHAIRNQPQFDLAALTDALKAHQGSETQTDDIVAISVEL